MYTYKIVQGSNIRKRISEREGCVLSLQSNIMLLNHLWANTYFHRLQPVILRNTSVFPEYIKYLGKIRGIPVIDVMPSDHHQLIFGALCLSGFTT